MAKKIPEINASSTADIAFLLLIFFLVTTTMNVDSGMFRRLPPFQPDNTEAPKIAKRNILQLLVNRYNDVLLDGEEIDVKMVKPRTIEFLLNANDDPTLPEKTEKEINLLGVVEISKGIVSLRNDVGTSYETYIAVQDQLAMAFNEVRDMKAMSRFGKKYLNLTGEQQEAIKNWVPMQISEAEPKKVKGK
ncbi:MAG: biopolymer transporter ExbD [Culturomica sp.]|jgi:biopolymer transport protein ExbD|nr:biopolymer transporter ExbD [Culturomica sp.]